MKSFIVALGMLFLAGFSKSCSISSDYEFKSIAELTRLAPLVLQAKVVAVAGNRYEYNATLNVTHVYKGKLNDTQIVADGFADTASCRSEVSVGDNNVFFLNIDPFRARYDDVSSAVKPNTSEVFEGILEGLCCPYTIDCPTENPACSGGKMADTSIWLFIAILASVVKILTG